MRSGNTDYGIGRSGQTNNHKTFYTTGSPAGGIAKNVGQTSQNINSGGGAQRIARSAGSRGGNRIAAHFDQVYRKEMGKK